MSSETTDPQPTETNQTAQDVWVVRLAAVVFLLVVGLVNAGMIEAFQHHVGRGVGEMLIFVNFMVLTAGIAGMSPVKRWSKGAPRDSYLIAVIAGTVLAWALAVIVLNGRSFGHYSF